MVACGSPGLPCCDSSNCVEGICNIHTNLCEKVKLLANCATTTLYNGIVPIGWVETQKCQNSLTENNVCDCLAEATVVAQGMDYIDFINDKRITIALTTSEPYAYTCPTQWVKNDSESHLGKSSYICKAK